tara:strand:+ start:7909 stop:8208 length:300 start_codon:yes stop_codon:yes gene_type:complete
MIKICKIQKLIYSSDCYYIFSGWCGEPITLVYEGNEPPKPLKTVDYKITGEMVKHEKYGNQFFIYEYEKVGAIKIAKETETQRVQRQSNKQWLDELNNN